MVSVEEKDWLLKVFPKFMNQVIRGVNKDAYIKAETIINGRASFPNCSCSYTSYQNRINQLYSEWLKKINT